MLNDKAKFQEIERDPIEKLKTISTNLLQSRIIQALTGTLHGQFFACACRTLTNYRAA